MDAHLFLDGGTVQAIALADLGVGAAAHGQELRHDEKRNAFRALRRIGQTRQHQVHDALGHVVLAGGNEDLFPGDRVAAVRLRNRLRTQHAQVGAAMSLRQAHRSGPLAGHHLRQVQILLFRGPVLQQALVRADREPRIHRPGLVGRVLHLVERDLQQVRQALPAVLGLARQPLPARLAESVIRLLEALRRLYRLGRRVVGAAFDVAVHVGRQQPLLAELARLFDNMVHRLNIQIGVTRNLVEFPDRTEDFVQHELLIAQWRFVDGHAYSLAARERDRAGRVATLF